MTKTDIEKPNLYNMTPNNLSLDYNLQFNNNLINNSNLNTNSYNVLQNQQKICASEANIDLSKQQQHQQQCFNVLSQLPCSIMPIGTTLSIPVPFSTLQSSTPITSTSLIKPHAYTDNNKESSIIF